MAFVGTELRAGVKRAEVRIPASFRPLRLKEMVEITVPPFFSYQIYLKAVGHDTLREMHKRLGTDTQPYSTTQKYTGKEINIRIQEVKNSRRSLGLGHIRRVIAYR